MGERRKVSVIIRSYNRYSQLIELLERLLEQDYSPFEIVIVDQSTVRPTSEVTKLQKLIKDSRIRLIDMEKPVGGARARNIGVENADGEIILMIDDDDLPLGKDFISKHASFYRDPDCIGVTGRHVLSLGETCPYRDPEKAWKRCMSFSPILKIPRVYARIDRPKKPVMALHGTNASFRRSLFERFGGFDEDTPIEDEASFCYRVQRYKKPSEYFLFDPNPVLIRGADIKGGLNKRFITPPEFFERIGDFCHHIIRRYFPVRFYLLYPLYFLRAIIWTVEWMLNEAKGTGSSLTKIMLGLRLLIESPIRWMMCLFRSFLPTNVRVYNHHPARWRKMER